MRLTARLQPRAAALVLLALLVGMSLGPIRYLPEAHAGDLLVPQDWREAHPGAYTITVAVLMDEEWMERFGPEARFQAQAVLTTAGGHLAPAGIRLQPVLYGDWLTSSAAPDIVDLLGSLEMQRPAANADLVIGLTAGYRGREGGASRPQGSHLVVKHHPYRTDRDTYVLTHEIGHVLGLHECDDDCLCFMTHDMYDPDEHWCEHHLELLRANGGYFHYVDSQSS